MLELAVSSLKSALGQGATASRSLMLDAIRRSDPSAASVPTDGITPCVVKFTGQPARKNRHLASTNLWLKVKLTLWLKEMS